MNLMDVVALAKAGYSVKDVKELIALSKEEPKDEVKEEPKDDIKEPRKSQRRHQKKSLRKISQIMKNCIRI